MESAINTAKKTMTTVVAVLRTLCFFLPFAAASWRGASFLLAAAGFILEADFLPLLLFAIVLLCLPVDTDEPILYRNITATP